MSSSVEEHTRRPKCTAAPSRMRPQFSNLGKPWLVGHHRYADDLSTPVTSAVTVSRPVGSHHVTNVPKCTTTPNPRGHRSERRNPRCPARPYRFAWTDS